MQGSTPVGEAAPSTGVAPPGAPGQQIRRARAPSLAPPAELCATVNAPAAWFSVDRFRVTQASALGPRASAVLQGSWTD